MKIIERILVAFQVVFVALGLVMMFRNIANTARLSLPYSAYDERIFLMHTLDAVQILVLFGAVLALQPLIVKIRSRVEPNQES